MPSVLYVIPLFLIAITLSALIKNRKIRIFALVIFTVFIIAELISVYFSGGLVDYQFYVNLNLNDIVSGLLIFKLQALLAVVCFLALLFAAYKLTGWLSVRCQRRYLIIVLCLSATAILPKNGPVSRLYEIYEVVRVKPTDFRQALIALGIDPDGYPNKPSLTAAPGKNIIVISMESLEQGFLTPRFPGLTPNLTQLSERFTYFPNLTTAPGSTWTLASLYTYMTGVPLFLGGYDTSPFDDKTRSLLVSLGDVLHKAGYETRYVMSSPDFAGMGNAIRLFGVPVISEKTYPNRYPPAPFGLYDRDIFDLAKHELSQLEKRAQPFVLFISTISTHAPNGFYDSRMAKVIAPKASDLEFAVASADYNLGLFINYLDENGLLENSVIYLFPDHLMMGYGTDVIDKLSQQRRQLYLITNAEQKTLGQSTDAKIYQIDLPRLIINGAEIRTNAKFLTDFLAETDKAAFIERHKSDIAALNSSSLLTDKTDGG